ncbi:hypothetical protein [Microvirga massiliensis]|uniref:hypothetical protein n=1 Tax=Microvirga massiliensis TaxID=1033741 RepID=UPI00062B6A67|nr:hypothetical protein [Microvirga massiliensis]
MAEQDDGLPESNVISFKRRPLTPEEINRRDALELLRNRDEHARERIEVMARAMWLRMLDDRYPPKTAEDWDGETSITKEFARDLAKAAAEALEAHEQRGQ